MEARISVAAGLLVNRRRRAAAVMRQFGICDRAARGGAFREGELLALLNRAERAAEDWRRRLPQPNGQRTIVSGHRLMELTGLSPGPKVGELLRDVTDWAIDNGVTDSGEIEAHIASVARTRSEGRDASGKNG